MISSFLFIRWRNEKKKEEADEEAVIRLSLLESLTVRRITYREGAVMAH